MRRLIPLCLILAGSCAQAQSTSIDPSGLYTHVFEVGDAAREWFHIVPIPLDDPDFKFNNGADSEPKFGQDMGQGMGQHMGQSTDQKGATTRYYLTDIYGLGFTASINDLGEIELDEGGSGQFADANNAVFTTSSGQTYTLIRAPLTDSSFPLVLDQSIPVNPMLTGDWDILEQSLDVRTGNPIGADFIDVFTLTVDGMGLRSADSLGTYYQATMERADRALMRYYVSNFGQSPLISLFDSYPDTSNNFPRDMIGEVFFPDINHFEVKLALQGRTNVPFRLQFFLWIRGERQDPYPIGDLNGDRLIDSNDRELFSPIMGLDPADARFNLAADLDGNKLIDARDLAVFDGNPTGSYAIGPEISGSWFDPTHDGEGWNLIVIDSERVLVTWFSYQADSDEQAWFIGVGRIEGNQIILPQMLIPVGGEFGAGFDPATVISPPWGGATMWFDSCTSGGISWNAAGDYANGALGLVRLSTLGALPCIAATAKGLSGAAFAGHWYDPSHNGEGWLIEVLDDSSALVYWFTFDGDGNQVWLVGTGTIDGDTLSVTQMTQTRGTRFGAEFDSTAIELIPWGSLTFVLSQCGQGVLTYNSTLAEFGAGQLNPQLLVPYAGISCSETR